jgi:hypothetical protein
VLSTVGILHANALYQHIVLTAAVGLVLAMVLGVMLKCLVLPIEVCMLVGMALPGNGCNFATAVHCCVVGRIRWVRVKDAMLQRFDLRRSACIPW